MESCQPIKILKDKKKTNCYISMQKSKCNENIFLKNLSMHNILQMELLFLPNKKFMWPGS
jgi:hypothetical protein